MKKYVIALIMLLGAIAYAQRGAGPGAPAPAGGPPAQGQGGGGGRGRGNPELQAALAARAQLEQTTPQIPFDAVSLPHGAPDLGGDVTAACPGTPAARARRRGGRALALLEPLDERIERPFEDLGEVPAGT